MKKILITLLFALAFVAVPANAFTMDAQGGICNRVSHMGHFNMSFYGHLWYPIDQMVFAGVGIGYQELDNVGYMPLSGSLWVRLPTCSARMIRCSGELAADSTSKMATAHRLSFRPVTSS